MAKEVEAGKAFVRLSIKEDLRALRKMSKKLKTWGAGLATAGAGIAAVGTGVIGAMAGMTSAFVASGDELDKMSQRTGVSVEQLSALGYAAKLSGASLADVETGMRFLAKQGIGADQLDAIADRFAAMEDPTARTALAIELFGRSGTALIPMLLGGSAGLAAFREEAERLGIVMSTKDAKAAAALGDAMDKVKSAVRGVYIQVGAALAPALTDFAERAAKAVAGVIKFVKENREMVITVAKVAAIVALAGTALMGIGGMLATAGLALGGLASIISLVFNPIFLAVAAVGTLIALVVTWAAVAAVAFVKFTKAGQRMWRSVRGVLQNVADKVKYVFGGILNAIKVGDIELAWQIMWTGIKYYFFGAIKEIVTCWGKFIQDILSDMQTIAQLVARYSGLGFLIDTDKHIAEAMSKLKAGAAKMTAYMTPDTTELEELRRKLDSLIREAATAAGRAETEAAYPEPKKTPPPVPAMANATSAGTFSAAAARIMFMGQGENYQKRTADATEETAKMIRRMRNVNPVFVGYGV